MKIQPGQTPIIQPSPEKTIETELDQLSDRMSGLTGQLLQATKEADASKIDDIQIQMVETEKELAVLLAELPRDKSEECAKDLVELTNAARTQCDQSMIQSMTGKGESADVDGREVYLKIHHFKQDLKA